MAETGLEQRPVRLKDSQVATLTQGNQRKGGCSGYRGSHWAPRTLPHQRGKSCCVFATPGITAVTVMNIVQNISLAFEPVASCEGRIFICTLQMGKGSYGCVKCLA